MNTIIDMTRTLNLSEKRLFGEESTTITAMQYNLLSIARRFSTYETIGGLFWDATKDSTELTIIERIWGMIFDIVNEIAQCFEIEDERILDTLINRSDKLKLMKIN